MHRRYQNWDWKSHRAQAPPAIFLMRGLEVLHAIGTIRRQAESEGDTEILGKCDDLLGRIERVKTAQEAVTLELLDPIGHSQILHGDATSTEISEEQAKELDPGPVYPVFDLNSEGIN